METRQIPVLEWTNFLQRFRWFQGEHLLIVGPTGTGKTTLLLSLLYKRQSVVIFATKPYPPKDEINTNTLAKFARKEHYTKLPIWTPATDRKIVLWPDFRKPGDELKQRRVFGRAMMDIFLHRGWCVAADEIWYHTKRLALEPLFETFLSQGRELGITVAAATQRPSHISLLFYSEPTHFFFYGLTNSSDRKRLAEINNIDPSFVAREISQLPEHTFLYVNARTKEMIKSKAAKL